MEKRAVVVWVLFFTGSCFEPCAGKFLDDHDNGNPYTGPLVNGTTLQWINKASREWAENDNNGCYPAKNEKKEGQLICDYACTNNGVLSVVLQSSNRELSHMCGVFFRWSGTRSFYYMIVDMNSGTGYPHRHSLRLFKDTVPDTQDQLTKGILIAKNLPFPSGDKTFTVSVLLSGNEYHFFLNGVKIGAHTDSLNPHPSGKIGYGCNKIKINDYRQLLFKRVQWSDDGGEKPTLLVQPQPFSYVKDGSLFYIWVSATGDPLPSYQWEKYGGGTWNQIEGADDSLYLMVKANSGHGGTYRVQAKNVYGSVVSKEAVVSPYQPPVITRQPRDTVIGMDMDAHFSLEASGYPLTYQWRHCTTTTWEPIPSATHDTYSFKPDTHSIRTAFHCVVKAGPDSVISTTVKGAFGVPSVITLHPVRACTLRSGTALALQVAAEGVPAPRFQWQKMFNSLWWNLANASGPSYVKPSADSGDNGVYRCGAFNGFGADTSAEASVTVYRLPSILQMPQDTFASAGDKICFVCRASGYPLEYRWQRFTNGMWAACAGANASVYAFTAQKEDDGAQFRCMAFVWKDTAVSVAAKLTITSKPHIQSVFPAETVLTQKASLQLTAQASGDPPPAYAWYFNRQSGTDSTLVTTAQTLLLKNLSRERQGYYFFIAKNVAGAAKSPRILAYVCTPASIVADLPSTVFAKTGSPLVLDIGAVGDGTLHYQWYCNGLPLPRDTLNRLTFPNADSTMNRSVYRCRVCNVFKQYVIGFDTSSACTVMVGDIYNPFRIHCSLPTPHATTSIALKIWGVGDISPFPVKNPVLPPGPWADTLCIFYKTNGYPNVKSQGTVVKYPTERIKNGMPDTLREVIHVPPVGAAGNNDSLYWWSYTLLWHLPKNTIIDSLWAPFVNAGRVYMVDSVTPENRLGLTAAYIMGTDSMKVTVDSLVTLNVQHDSVFTVLVSKSRQFSPVLASREVSVAAVVAAGLSKYHFSCNGVGTPPIVNDSVFCSVRVTGKNKVFSAGTVVRFDIGNGIPVYSGALHADSTYKCDRIAVSWDSPLPDGGADSVRIWTDTGPIPLKNAFSYPFSQVRYIHDKNATKDTIIGFLGGKRYHLGLQICRYGVWSYVTEKSRTAVVTAADSLSLCNTIVLDSLWFIDTTHTIQARWRIQSSSLHPGNRYSFGVSYGLGTDFKSKKPAAWREITQDSATAPVAVSGDIVFDTSYYAGIWLRSVKKSDSTVSPVLAPPTDKSSGTVRIPSFTWQEIGFTVNGPDTVYAANRSIILVRTSSTTVFTDTVRAWPLPPLPPGLQAAGACCFSFAKKIPLNGPCILGMRLEGMDRGRQPPVRAYQLTDAGIRVRHGCVPASGVLWITLPATDRASPFCLLSDCGKPAVAIAPYSDTVVPGYNVFTKFRVTDDVTNVRWRFLYGAGNQGYPYGAQGEFDSTGNSLITEIHDSIVSARKRTGVRALFIVDDGTWKDTLGVPRQVRFALAETVQTAALEWTPLRANVLLDKADLENVFMQSRGTAWRYTPVHERLFRWAGMRADDPRNSWLEYADSSKHLFYFVPGAVIWHKGIHGGIVRFGSGVSTSLREPYTVELKPKNWTDFSLPFAFPIALKTVLEANGANADSVEIYYWKKTGKTYEATPVYIPCFDGYGAMPKDTLKSESRFDCYTIFNQSAAPLALVIPPVSLPLALQDTPASRPRPDSCKRWEVRFFWRPAGDSGGYGMIRLGYDNTLPQTLFGPLAPTMNAYNAGVCDSATGEIYGYAVRNACRGEGTCFEILLRGGGIFEYYSEETPSLDEPLQVRIFNPDPGTYEYGTAVTPCTGASAGGSALERYVVVGTERYLSEVRELLMPVRFRLVSVYPNPFRNTVRIALTLPPAVDEIAVALFDIRGKLIHEQKEKKGLHKGFHVISIPGRVSAALSSGAYILRLTGVTNGTQRTIGGERVLFCVK